MTLVTGLGNPGEKYKNNRHNIGFMVIDKLIDDLKPTKINKSTFNGQLYKHKETFFLKPTTYMNNSGLSVISVAKYYNIDKLIVIHDDMEITFGSIRIKHAGGNAGHNGLRSIDAHFGKNYDRIRLGIGKPDDKDQIVNYVLSDFYKEQKDCLEILTDRAKDAVIYLLEHDTKETAEKFTSKKSLCKDNQGQ